MDAMKPNVNSAYFNLDYALNVIILCFVKRIHCWSFQVLFLALVITPIVQAGTAGDSLCGKWYTERKEAQFEFYRFDTEYRARLKPIKYPELKDTNNPIDSLKTRRLSGVTTITGLFFNEKRRRWEGGKVYNPEDGKDYSCYCELKNNGMTLIFHGFLGVSLLGKSQTWIRVDQGDAEP
jgi:uncharacterized protein (DUF2147 family)